MAQLVTVRGFVATDAELKNYVVKDGAATLSVTGFRLASTDRRFDSLTGQWVDGMTNWFSVSCFRELAVNVAVSVHKGDPVVVTGRLRVRPFERPDHSTGTSVDIEAESVGHDLVLGTATFSRRSHAAQAPAADGAAVGTEPFVGAAAEAPTDGDGSAREDVLEDEGPGERVDAETGELLDSDAA